MPVIVSTPGSPSANSYEEVAEATAYFDGRAPLPTPWIASGAETYMVMATRVLDAMSVPRRTLKRDGKFGKLPYYLTSRAWTGYPATDAQALAWPRKGMKDRLGRDILETVVPQELKDAESELAGQLRITDRTLDSDVAVQGITSVKAGTVGRTRC